MARADRLLLPVRDEHGYQIECARCGKPFSAARPDANYCSETCRRAAGRAADNLDAYVAGLLSRPCACGCGVTLDAPANPRQRFATPACRTRYHRRVRASSDAAGTKRHDAAPGPGETAAPIDAPTPHDGDDATAGVAPRRAKTRLCANPECRVTFIPARQGHKFCTAKCRVTTHRQRRRDAKTEGTSC